MDVRGACRYRPAMFSKRRCGFSTRVHNGTCCRKAIRTTKLCIDAFKVAVARERRRFVRFDLPDIPATSRLTARKVAIA